MPHVAWQDLGPWKYSHWTESLNEALRWGQHAAAALRRWDHEAIADVAEALYAAYRAGRAEGLMDYGDD